MAFFKNKNTQECFSIVTTEESDIDEMLDELFLLRDTIQEIDFLEFEKYEEENEMEEYEEGNFRIIRTKYADFVEEEEI